MRHSPQRTRRKFKKRRDPAAINLLQTTEVAKNRFLEFLNHPVSDLYHWLLVISWQKFLLLVSFFFLALNALFALAYLSTGDGIANAKPGSFTDAFFFSVQSLSTIGYGAMHPRTIYAQAIVTVEVLVGLLLLAILTGLVFARFSRPTARLLFSRFAVVCPFEGVPTFMFRVANQRGNRIIEAQIAVSLVRNEVTIEGHQIRRFYDLQLLRSQTPVFGLTWLVMHPLDETSPLYEETLETLAEEDAQVWVTLTGLDETFSQTIHARYVYTLQEILWSMRFVDIFFKKPDGTGYKIDYTRFHDVISLEKD